MLNSFISVFLLIREYLDIIKIFNYSCVMFVVVMGVIYSIDMVFF